MPRREAATCNQDGFSFGEGNVAANVFDTQAGYRTQLSVNKIHSRL